MFRIDSSLTLKVHAPWVCMSECCKSALQHTCLNCVQDLAWCMFMLCTGAPCVISELGSFQFEQLLGMVPGTQKNLSCSFISWLCWRNCQKDSTCTCMREEPVQAGWQLLSSCCWKMHEVRALHFFSGIWKGSDSDQKDSSVLGKHICCHFLLKMDGPFNPGQCVYVNTLQP